MVKSPIFLFQDGQAGRGVFRNLVAVGQRVKRAFLGFFGKEIQLGLAVGRIPPVQVILSPAFLAFDAVSHVCVLSVIVFLRLFCASLVDSCLVTNYFPLPGGLCPGHQAVPGKALQNAVKAQMAADQTGGNPCPRGCLTPSW